MLTCKNDIVQIIKTRYYNGMFLLFGDVCTTCLYNIDNIYIDENTTISLKSYMLNDIDTVNELRNMLQNKTSDVINIIGNYYKLIGISEFANICYNEAMKQVRETKKINPDVMFNYAMYLIHDDIYAMVSRSSESYYLFEYLANMWRHHGAMHMLGQSTMNEKDLLISAKLNNTDAMFTLARLYRISGKQNEHIKYLNMAIDNGHVGAFIRMRKNMSIIKIYWTMNNKEIIFDMNISDEDKFTINDYVKNATVDICQICYIEDKCIERNGNHICGSCY